MLAGAARAEVTDRPRRTGASAPCGRRCQPQG